MSYQYRLALNFWSSCVLGLMIHTTIPGLLFVVSGVEPRVSCLAGKHSIR